MKRNLYLTGVGLMLAMTGLFSCKKNDTAPTSSLYYPIEYRLTDAAGPFEELDVDIQSVEVNSDASSNTGWVRLGTKSGIYDLTKLTNGTDVFLASGNLLSDHIEQIRITLGVENTVLTNTLHYGLIAPATITLNVRQDLTAGASRSFVIDMDAARSVIKLGNGKYQLLPYTRVYDIKTTAAIQGTVSPAGSRPLVYAIAGKDTFGTMANAEGRFMVRGITSTGNCSLLLRPQGSLPVKTVDGISLTAGKTTAVGTLSLQ